LRIDLIDRSFLIDNVRIEDDPKLVLKMLSDKYGFPVTKTKQVRFTPDTSWTTGQTVCFKFKMATSCSAVRLEPFTRRTFTIHIADDPWNTGQILLSSAFGKNSDFGILPIRTTNTGHLAVPDHRRTTKHHEER
jgi:hypothetical protein